MRDIDKNLAIVREAVTWEYTPYHHHARIKRVGVDCAQLVVACALASGCIEDASQFPAYSPQWHLHNREEKLLEVLDKSGCVEIDKDKTYPGDIMCFKFGHTTSHLGIMLNGTQFIHARYDIGRVVINTIQHEWVERWTKSYAFPGVING